MLKVADMITPPEVFKSLADETRVRATLLIANQGELYVCELMCALDDSQAEGAIHASPIHVHGQ